CVGSRGSGPRIGAGATRHGSPTGASASRSYVTRVRGRARRARRRRGFGTALSGLSLCGTCGCAPEPMPQLNPKLLAPARDLRAFPSTFGAFEPATGSSYKAMCSPLTRNVYSVDFPYRAGFGSDFLSHLIDFIGVPYRIRTGVAAVRGRCPGPLDEGDEARSVNSDWRAPDQACGAAAV